MTATKRRATVEDLYRVPENGKAELVHGELLPMSPTGLVPGRAGGVIYASLLMHEQTTDEGMAVPDNVGFVVNLPHRESFSPDAAWYTGEAEDLKFAEGSPIFAVEVRSENDYGPAMERAIRAKIADYFEAGTLVAWDVDLQSEETIKKYIASDPDNPTTFRRGDIADAEPAVPGWRFAVDTLFRTRNRLG